MIVIHGSLPRNKVDAHIVLRNSLYSWDTLYTWNNFICKIKNMLAHHNAQTYIHTPILTYIHTFIHTYIHTYTHTRVCSLCGAHTFCIRHFAPLKPTKKKLLGFSRYKSYVEVLWCLSPKWSITTHMCHVQSMKCKQSGDAIISLLIRHWRMQNFSGGGGATFLLFIPCEPFLKIMLFDALWSIFLIKFCH